MHRSALAILELCCAVASILAMGCGSSTSADVAYEDAYVTDYYYPIEVAYAGIYSAGWSSTVLAAAPLSAGLSPSVIPTFDGGAHLSDGGLGTLRDGGLGDRFDAAGRPPADAAAVADAGTTGRGGGHDNVVQAIRNVALGGTMCAGKVTTTRPTGSTVCGQSGTGITMVFTGCQLSGGGTLDGTVTVALTRTASNATCDATTSLSLGYMSTVTDLTYTGASGAKIMIPAQTSTATLTFSLGQTPATISLDTSGEIQRFDARGAMTSDRTYTGTRTFTSISLADQSYTVSGTINVTDKGDGGTGTMTGTDLRREADCCKPVSGTLAVTRTGGKRPGAHAWTFTSTCGSATLDGKTVSLLPCL